MGTTNVKQDIAALAVFALLIAVVIFMAREDEQPVVADKSDTTTAEVSSSSSSSAGAGADGTSDSDGASSPFDGESDDSDVTLPDDFVPLPSFDIVRVERDGDAVMAGTAAPGADVTVMTRDGAVATTTADDNGEWVIVLEEPLAPGDHELWLSADAGDGTVVESAEVLVMAVPDTAESGDTAIASAEPSAEAKDEVDGSSGYSQGAASSSSSASSSLSLSTGGSDAMVEEAVDTATDTVAGAGEEVFAVVVPREGEGDVDVLQAPGDGVGIAGGDNLILESLSYNDEGTVTLSGQAEPGSTVVPYVDGQPVGPVVVGNDGNWSLTLDEALAEGQYELRVDQVGDDGDVNERLETPFQQSAFTMPSATESVVVIQPGNNLWFIARRVYGEGVHYTQIFEANRNQIADPDLIYPGQIFVVPSGTAE